MDAVIHLQGQEIAYQLERSRRRSVGLTVSAERGLVVRCPMRMSRRDVDDAIRSKARWILTKLKDVQAERSRCAPVVWRDGLVLPLVSGPLQLRVVPGRTPFVRRWGQHLEVCLAHPVAAARTPAVAAPPVAPPLPHFPQAAAGHASAHGSHVQPPAPPARPPLPPHAARMRARRILQQLGFNFQDEPAPPPPNAREQTAPAEPPFPSGAEQGALPPQQAALREQVVAWLREEARRVLEARCEAFRHALALPPVRLRIKDPRTRWGSCSALGNLNFSWRLVLAPAAVLDYVVVHELCHRVHLNHSQVYWALVGRILPDYARHRAWLQREGATLHRW